MITVDPIQSSAISGVCLRGDESEVKVLRVGSGSLRLFGGSPWLALEPSHKISNKY